jgi:hypothetical protein
MNNLNKNYGIDNVTVVSMNSPLGTIWQAGTRITVTSVNKIYILILSNSPGDTITTLITNNKVAGVTMDIPTTVGIVSEGTVVEEGNETFHKTTITLSGTFGTIAGGANLSVGKLIYTFPAGVIRVVSVALNGVALTQSDGNVTADTPELGLGSVIGSGVVAVLSSTLEDILTAQVMGDCDGTAKLAVAASSFTMLAAAAHTVHLNVADGWAADGDAGLGFTGEVVITWELLS